MGKLDTIKKLYEDSNTINEYVKEFADDDAPEEYMETVYKRELGSSFVRVESGVVEGLDASQLSEEDCWEEYDEAKANYDNLRDNNA